MAEKVELHAYPFPEGMDIPRLMPYQEFPWNGDGYLAAEVLRLKEAHGLRHAFETGTCLGSTTIWLSKTFAFVTSTEIHKPYRDIAVPRLKIVGAEDRWCVIGGDASELQDQLRDYVGIDTLCFLDAHWGPNCPLLDELEAISAAKAKPCIVIHDFDVPGTDFGFDKMPDGRPFNMELVKPYLDRIYGEGKYRTNYPTKVEGAKRGWLSVEPC